MRYNSNFKMKKNNNYIEYYNNNVIRRWFFNMNDNLWYEFCPDYSSNLGKFIKTGRTNYQPLEPIIYKYKTNNNYSFNY